MAILLYIIILISWLLSSIIFPFNKNFYNSLNLPFFAPPKLLFPIAWTIIYILISLSIFILLKKDELNKNYLFAYLTNYILNQSFSLFFFYFQNLTLTLYTTILLFFSTIYLFLETKRISKISSFLLIPYLIWTTYATILFISVFFLN